MKNKKLITTVLLLMAAALLIIIFIKKNSDKFGNSNKAKPVYEMKQTMAIENHSNKISQGKSNEFLNTTYEIAGITTMTAFNLNTTRALLYTIKDYYFTEQLPDGIDSSKFSDSEELPNEDSRVYMVLSISIENPYDKEIEKEIDYYVNSIYVDYVDEYGNFYSPSEELRYFSNQTITSGGDIYLYTFEPHETIDTTLVYVCEKDKVEKYSVYLTINNSGAYLHDENVKEFLLDKERVK